MTINKTLIFSVEKADKQLNIIRLFDTIITEEMIQQNLNPTPNVIFWRSKEREPTEMLRVNYTLRALPVPAGKHTIEFRFEP